MIAAIVLIAACKNDGVVNYTVGLSLLNLGIAIALDRYMRMPESMIGRLLNLTPMVWLGLVSYSLYLWQQLFAWSLLPTLVKLLLMVWCATLSYYAVERPFQRLRRWLELREAASLVKQPDAI
jgi:peptidoglycan/LPS O-acetylase OafA/YrhL